MGLGGRVQAGNAVKMIPHTGLLRRRLEAALILLAAQIIAGRNFPRSGVVSRRDNNEMGYMAECSKASPTASSASTRNPFPIYPHACRCTAGGK
jgi:hypothetical protein